MRLISRLGLSACFLASVSDAATILSGFDTDEPAGGRFHIRGVDFEFIGAHEEGYAPLGGPSPSGTFLRGPNFSGTFRNGSGTYRGQYYPTLDFNPEYAPYGTAFTYDWPSVTLNRAGVYSVPFVMNGRLCASPTTGHMPDECLADLSVLTGAGVLRLYVDPFIDKPAGAPDAWIVTRIQYEFVPEPASAGLALLGLAGVWAASSRLRAFGRS